jgi:hypothetical protein
MARWRSDYAGERRTDRVTVQLTPAERAAVETRAARSRRPTVSDYFRWCALEGKETAPGLDAETVHGIEAQLRRAGNNLNQVAHHLNATGHLRSRDELDRCISDLKVAIARVIAL